MQKVTTKHSETKKRMGIDLRMEIEMENYLLTQKPKQTLTQKLMLMKMGFVKLKEIGKLTGSKMQKH